MAAEKLRDLSQPIDVAVLDATVAAFFVTGSKEEVVQSLCVFFWTWNIELEKRVGVSRTVSLFRVLAV